MGDPVFAIALPFLGGIGVPELIICGCLMLPTLLVALLVVLLISRNKAPSNRQGSTAPAGWLPDPSGRHQVRFWDGATWTAAVSDHGVQASDPL
jgi:hypothetical protein